MSIDVFWPADFVKPNMAVGKMLPCTRHASRYNLRLFYFECAKSLYSIHSENG